MIYVSISLILILLLDNLKYVIVSWLLFLSVKDFVSFYLNCATNYVSGHKTHSLHWQTFIYLLHQLYSFALCKLTYLKLIVVDNIKANVVQFIKLGKYSQSKSPATINHTLNRTIKCCIIHSILLYFVLFISISQLIVQYVDIMWYTNTKLIQSNWDSNLLLTDIILCPTFLSQITLYYIFCNFVSLYWCRKLYNYISMVKHHPHQDNITIESFLCNSF